MSFWWIGSEEKFFFLTKVWTSCSEAPLTGKQIDSGENIIFNKLFDFKIFFPFIFHLFLVWGACVHVWGGPNPRLP